MLSNAVLLGLLLVRQLVEYVVKFYSPRVFIGQIIGAYAVKCCPPRVITDETIGCVCCQMLCY